MPAYTPTRPAHLRTPAAADAGPTTLQRLALVLVWLAVASGAVVFSEPAPVDLLTMGLIVGLPLVGLVTVPPALWLVTAIWAVCGAGALVASCGTGFFGVGSLPRPRYRVVDVLLVQVQLGQLGAHGVAALDAYRRQHDLATARLHIEVLRGPNRGGDAFGQRELVFRGHFGKHCRVLGK